MSQLAHNFSPGNLALSTWRLALMVALAVIATAVLPAAIVFSPLILVARYVRKVRLRNQSWSLGHSARRGRSW